MNRWRLIVAVCVVAALAVIALANLPWAKPLTWPSRPVLTGWHSEVPAWRLGAPAQPIEGLAAEGVGLLANYLLGVVMVFVLPRRVRRMAESLRPGGRRLARIFLIGLACAILAAAVSILAAFSVQMLPVPILLLGMLFLATLVGVVAIEFELGRGLLTRAGWYADRPLLALGLGTLLIFALTRLPILGWLALAGAWLTGTGVAVVTRIGSGRSWTLRPLVEDTVE
jgi:hypothetical protein